MTTETQQTETVSFETHPDRYKHWKLSTDGPVARLIMAVEENEPMRPGYELKLNSYDLGVDIELHDAIQRLRFEHPEVRTVIVTGGYDRVFCAGANIHMLGSSSHSFKVNFCKFTNETRLAIEDASRNSGQRYLAALNGTCAGGGYELAMACDEIVLIEDGNSTVSLPETPLLAVLPGTGGLTRLVDKRKVRRDLADVFCTVAEGIKGKRAKQWGLVDDVVSRSRFDAVVEGRANDLAADSPARAQRGVKLTPLNKTVEPERIEYEHVSVTINREQRVARLTVNGPAGDLPEDADAIRHLGASWWPLAAFRELDDALCHLRFNEETIGLFLLETAGEPEHLLALDRTLDLLADDWFVSEVRLLIARTLRRLDMTARSLFALIEPGSCFAGTLLELALAADRSYMLDDPDRPTSVAVSAMNGGSYPMSHGVSRLEARFLGEPGRVAELLGEPRSYDPQDAEEAGLVTVVADDIDYEDEVRIAVEERVSLSPDALTGMEANLRFPGAENCDSKIFGRLTAWQNWIFQRPNAVGPNGALTLYGKPERPSYDPPEDLMQLHEKIPNNVNLHENRRLQRALEKWQPNYLKWWSEAGPGGSQADHIYLRTAISVDAKGWANFDYVKMPDYRWGIFLALPEQDRKIPCGDDFGKSVWQEVPGEFRNALRRIIVTQGDTEPASVEQQRLLSGTAPSMYDCRNLFQVNVEEGRHLWAMVYLLHAHFGRDGREEAEELLERRSGDFDKPRILTTFNEPIDDWLSFFMFTTFTDRDGKYQLLALAESGFDPLSRTTRFMLTEEAHHMFVGETGVGRIIRRACELMKQDPNEDARAQGGIDLDTVQRFVNFWYSSSLDLFGGEISSNAADYFAAGLKGRAHEEKKFEDHVALEGNYEMELLEDGAIGTKLVPLRNAMNEILRDAYVDDNQRAVDRWNRVLREAEVDYEMRLPSRRFNRKMGVHAGNFFDVDGNPVSEEEFARRRQEWLPSPEDKAFIKNLMAEPVLEPGQMAHWIAPPARGINGKPIDFEYVRRA